MTVVIFNFYKNVYFKLDLTTMKYTGAYRTKDEAEKSENYIHKPKPVIHFIRSHLLVNNILAKTYLKTHHPELFI